MRTFQPRQRGTGHLAGYGPRGATLVELVISGMLLSSMMLIVVPMLKLVHGQGRFTDERQEALAEVTNIMERIVTAPFDELSTAQLKRYRVSRHVARQLREPQLRISAVAESGRKETVRIEIELDWIGRTARRERPVRLIAWVHDLQRRSAK